MSKPLNPNFPNGWNAAQRGVATLTDAERTWILRYDEPLAEARYVEPTYYIPGAPIGTVRTIGLETCNYIRIALGAKVQRQRKTNPGKTIPRMTLAALVAKFDLRAEWIQEVLDNPDKTMFRW